MDHRKIWSKISSNWRITFIIVFIAFMLVAIGMMYSPGSGLVENGKVDLSNVEFMENELVVLDGQWEFYWDRLLTSEDFVTKQPPKMDSHMKVPGSWNDKIVPINIYPKYGVATYRLKIKYPSNVKDPAIRIQRVSAAFKLYANGQFIVEVGKVSDNRSNFKGEYSQLIVALPNNLQELELIIQVANLDYIRGGLRESPVFGSKQVLEVQKMMLLSLQLLFIGSVLIFAIYYCLLFILQRKNKSALLFSWLCFNTALHSSLWGETPLFFLFPKMPLNNAILITYFTSYITVPIMILFVLSTYPLEYKKRMLYIVMVPNLYFIALLFTTREFMVSQNFYSLVLQIMQIIYIMYILIKIVLRKRDNALLMFISMGIFILSILADIINYLGINNINLSYFSLFGNFTVIMAMSFVQARLQANIYKKLILYNENLIESDLLKDKIMATEMSFLQAQIKPHFLYNALNAIANVCEKDGKIGGKLIIDLAIYLRGSLEFNHLDKMSTIEKELEFVNTYFNIEQARFGQKIQLLTDIEIPLDFQIPVLILQPLVENAVRHGISKNPGGGTVYLRMKQMDEGTYIEIEDDGVGMMVEKLAMLLNEERRDQSVGLLNIHHRLLRLYRRGIEITSAVDLGTCVRLVIPEVRRQE